MFQVDDIIWVDKIVPDDNLISDRGEGRFGGYIVGDIGIVKGFTTNNRLIVDFFTRESDDRDFYSERDDYWVDPEEATTYEMAELKETKVGSLLW